MDRVEPPARLEAAVCGELIAEDQPLFSQEFEAGPRGCEMLDDERSIRRQLCNLSL
jgi:hypothetical protein